MQGLAETHAAAFRTGATRPHVVLVRHPGHPEIQMRVFDVVDLQVDAPIKPQLAALARRHDFVGGVRLYAVPVAGMVVA